MMPTPPVDVDEIVYRQVGPGGNPIYCDPTREPPLHRALFLPSNEDADGLSLIRRRFRTEEWSAFRPEKTAVRYRLACLEVSGLNQVAQEVGLPQLTFEPSPDALDVQHGEPWAHCVITDVNRTQYEADQQAKKRIKEWALKLSQSVANSDIIGPFEEPTVDDPYRPI